MKELNFSYNWNNKLDCKAFTTLRLSDRFKLNDMIEIKLKKKKYGFGQIVGIKHFYLHDINSFIAYLDTGYDSFECQNILRKMYKNVDWRTQKINFYLIKKI